MPALHRLSAVKIKTAAPGKYPDGGGQWLHKSGDGGAQWVLRVTVYGRQREMGLGRLDDVSVKAARTQTARWQAVAREGKDPIKECERERREAAKPLNTLANIAADAALLCNSCLGHDGPLPLRRHATRTVSAVPSAMKRLMREMLIWISAVFRFGSLAAMRSPNALRQRIFASIWLRTWYPAHRFQNALHWCRVARRVSFRVIAAGQPSFHGRPFLRIGMIGVA